MVSEVLTIKTKGFAAVENITPKVEQFLEKNNLQNGWINIFTQHTTTTIKINEDEEGFHKDLKKIMFEKIALPTDWYHHNDLENRDPKTMCPLGGHECANGHSHIAQMLMGTASETVPVQNGKMLLGKWQQVLFIELDHSKERNIVFSFQGK